jgi:hypothetical protein
MLETGTDRRFGITASALALACLLGLPPALAEAPAAEAPPAAADTLAGLTWLTGSWQGTLGEDAVDEHWSAEAGGVMVGMFRWLKGGAPYLYELMTLELDAEGVLLRIKHFGPGLVAWEEKEESLRFRLASVGSAEQRFVEEGRQPPARLTYRRDGERAMTVTLDTERRGTPHRLELRYSRP